MFANFLREKHVLERESKNVLPLLIVFERFCSCAKKFIFTSQPLRILKIKTTLKLLNSAAKPAAHGEENAQQSGMNVILLRKILAVCG